MPGVMKRSLLTRHTYTRAAGGIGERDLAMSSCQRGCFVVHARRCWWRGRCVQDVEALGRAKRIQKMAASLKLNVAILYSLLQMSPSTSKASMAFEDLSLMDRPGIQAHFRREHVPNPARAGNTTRSLGAETTLVPQSSRTHHNMHCCVFRHSKFPNDDVVGN